MKTTKISQFVKKIIKGIRNIFPKRKGRYVHLSEAQEMQKYKNYFGKRKY